MIGLGLLLSAVTTASGGVSRSRLDLDTDAFGLIPQVTLGEKTEVYNGYDVETLKRKLAEFAPVTVTSDVTDFTEDERKVLDHIIQAAKYMDPIFNRQVFRWYNETREKLSQQTGDLATAQLEYYNMMRGPWDRQNHHQAFAVDIDHPQGAGFYPSHVTKEAWDTFVNEHPEDKEQLESLVTMVLGIHQKYSYSINIIGLL